MVICQNKAAQTHTLRCIKREKRERERKHGSRSQIFWTNENVAKVYTAYRAVLIHNKNFKKSKKYSAASVVLCICIMCAYAFFISADSFSFFCCIFAFVFISSKLCSFYRFIVLWVLFCLEKRRDNCFFLEFHCLFIVNSKKDREIQYII